MIGIVMTRLDEVVMVVVEGHSLQFKSNLNMQAMAPLDYIKFDYNGVVKEHPDLKDDDQWRQKAIQRLKDKLKTMTSEKEIMKYVLEDLTKFGWVGKYYQQNGMRPVKF